ncbi:MAG: septal ring lytic transglycosylase RlpA family protein [Thiobacillus sp.]|nr:septal ring lytic transglycosylase RlpA family protein [Thiobacillus sp.]
MTFRSHLPLLALAVSAYLAGCSSTPPTAQVPGKPSTKSASVTPPYKGGGYYKDDGPGLSTPDNLDAVPDAVPRDEPLHAFANNPYRVLGKSYTPMTSNAGYRQDGKASWYGRKFHGKPTSSGEPYDMYAMTAAHPTLPIPSYVRVTNAENGKSVVVRINDRGPFHDNRLIDLSYTAAYKLDVLKGVTPVTVEAVLPETAPSSFAAQAAEDVVEPTTQPVTLAAAAAPEVKPQPAEPTVAVPAMEAAKPAVSYYLQLGAFSSQARANDLLDKITARLSRDFPGVLRIAIDGLYKVQAGPFATPEEADRAAAQLRDEMGLKAFKVVSERPASTEAAVTATSGSGLYLQLAAVSSPAAAEALGQRIKARFGTELPGLAQVQTGNLYKVQAGPFATPAAAARLSLAYQQDFGIKPYQVAR